MWSNGESDPTNHVVKVTRKRPAGGAPAKACEKGPLFLSGQRPAVDKDFGGSLVGMVVSW